MNSPAGVLYVDAAAWVTWADADAAALLGIAVEELVGLPLGEVMGGDDQSVDRLRAVVESETPNGSSEVRIWRATGGWRWVRAVVSDQVHPAFGGRRVVLFDITDERLRRDARELLMDSVAEGMWVADQRGAILVANRSAARLLGISPEFFGEPLPVDVVRRFHVSTGEDLSWLARPVTAFLLGENPSIGLATTYDHPDGGPRRYFVRAVLHSLDGEPRVVVSVFDTESDMTLS